MSDPAPTRRREWAAVLGVYAVLATAAAVWLAIDRRPPEWDHANHLERAVYCARDLAAGEIRAVLEQSSFYPPLVPCLGGLMYRLFPSDVAAAQSVVIASLGVGMIATYWLGRRLAGGTAGVGAAVLFGTAPFVVFSSLRFQLDLPLAAAVAATLALLARTDGFTAPGSAVAAGVVAGLGLLTKPPFLVYVLPPALVVASRVRSRRAALHAGLAALVAALIALPWYGMRLLSLPFQVSSRSFTQAAEAGQPDALSAAALAFYPRTFVTQFGVVAVALFLIGMVAAVRGRQWLALSAVLLPFVPFELIQNKNFRYTLPLLPAVAVIAGIGFDALPGRWRLAVGAVAGVAALFQVGGTVAGVPGGIQAPGLGVRLVLASPPTRASWRHREILDLIAHDSGGDPGEVAVAANHAFFSASNFRYYAVRDGLPARWSGAWGDQPFNVNYVILKTGRLGPAFSVGKARHVNAQFALDPLLGAAFPVIGEFTLPDGTATVRVRRPRPVDGLRGAELARQIRSGIVLLLRNFVAEADDLRVDLDHDEQDLRFGRIRRATIAAARVRVGELRRPRAATVVLRDARLVLEGAAVNPARLATGRVELLALDRARVERLTVTQADLQEFLDALPRSGSRITLAEGDAGLHLVTGGPAVELRMTVRPGGGERPVVLEASGVRVGGVPIPDLLTGWVVRHFDPTLRWARLSVAIDVAPVHIRPGAIVVGP
jgi:hypothetical protein